MQLISIDELLGLAVVGTFLSVIIQWAKNKWGIDSDKVKLVTVALSLVIGTVYYLFSSTEIFVSIVGILAAASTVWSLLLKK